MPSPRSVVDVIVPWRSCWLQSLKTLRTSICLDSGGCVPIANSGPSFSPGSLRPSCSERSAPVTPPSTASGPRSLESRCVETGKYLTPWRGDRHLVGEVGRQHDSLLDVEVARRERGDRGDPARDRHARAAANGNAPVVVNSSVSSFVALSPRMTAIFSRAQVGAGRSCRPRRTGPRGSRRPGSSSRSVADDAAVGGVEADAAVEAALVDQAAIVAASSLEGLRCARPPAGPSRASARPRSRPSATVAIFVS